MNKAKYNRNERLKRARIINGFCTQKQAAAALGFTVQYYSRVERGMCDGCVEFWRKVQTVFNLTEADAWETMQNVPIWRK